MTKKALTVGGLALLILAISPFFPWVKIFVGIDGIQTLLGKIVLAVSVLVCLTLAGALVVKRGVFWAAAAGHVWGTVAFLWMGGLIWRMGSVLNGAEMRENPFALLVGVGSGLYMSTIAGLVAACACGFSGMRLPIVYGRPRNRSQLIEILAIGIIAGITLAIVNPGIPASCSPTNAAGGTPFESANKQENDEEVALKKEPSEATLPEPHSKIQQELSVAAFPSFGSLGNYTHVQKSAWIKSVRGRRFTGSGVVIQAIDNGISGYEVYVVTANRQPGSSFYEVYMYFLYTKSQLATNLSRGAPISFKGWIRDITEITSGVGEQPSLPEGTPPIYNFCAGSMKVGIDADSFSKTP